MKNKILQKIPTECPWRDTLYWYAVTDSTNAQAKLLAKQGAPQGTVLIAGQQTDGRGRMGRAFVSQANAGVYLSVILRPQCPPDRLMHLTCAAGVAMAEAIARVACFTPDLKWINDLVFQKKKLGGILTELSVNAKTGLTEYAVIGIGINCTQQSGDFPPQIRQIATSLSQAAGRPLTPDALAGEMVTALWQMSRRLLTEKTELMAQYRKLCVTLGKPVMVLRGDEKRPGVALDMDDDGGLLVAFPDSHTETVSSGEVTVRGFYDYV